MLLISNFVFKISENGILQKENHYAHNAGGGNCLIYNYL